MVPTKNLGRSVLPIAGINRNDRGEEAGRKGIPGNVILMKPVTFGPREFEDQLVLEQACSLSIKLTNEIEHFRASGDSFARRTEIDHGIKAIETALGGLKMILPATANVVGVDEV